jgi:DNA repair protein RecN (Recombination protein N)
VAAHREAASTAHAALNDERGVRDGVAGAVAALAGRAPFLDLEGRLRAAAAEIDDVAAELRDRGETLDEDPERLAAIRERRQLLRDLRRKYGESIADVLTYWSEAHDRLAELESHDARAAALDEERQRALAAVAEAESVVGQARRAAAPKLAEAVAAHLRQLAMPRARLDVIVGDADPGDEVTFLLGANPGEPALPLSKVASGGELARAMLACRLVLTTAPSTLVFDEVDAGIGGEAALAVGRALAALASDHQVLVVTHLPQVAAFADHQIAVSKREEDGRTVATATVLDAGGRIVELSRMLSGQPDSEAARGNAEELLATAARQRGR